MKRSGVFWVGLLAAVVGGCSSDEPSPAGRRISVLTYGRDLMPDRDLKETYLLPKPESVREWPQAGGVSHHVMQNPALAPKIMQAWKVSIGRGSRKNSVLLAEPVGARGVVYTVDSAGTVQAVSAASGKTVWRANATERKVARRIGSVGSGLALADGQLFVALGTGEVVAMDSGNGTELWRVDLKSPVRSAPTVYGGRLFVVTADNRLTALAQDDGRTLWQHYAFLESVSLLGKASPAIDEGIGVAAFA